MSTDPAEQALPEPSIVTGSREQLLHLLAEASEIEHTLMCSYLYAAFSLKRAGDADLSDRQSVAVEHWRKTIMSVAIEEMGHLLIVANLMLAVGGRPHFTRPNFPIAAGYFPAGVVVRLSGFSDSTLEHFIFLERPQGLEGDDADIYVQKNYVRGQAAAGLMPSAQDYVTIAHLYDAIRENLTRLANELGEAELFVGGPTGQFGREDVDMEGVARIATLADAMAAIDIVVEQGEGSPSDRDESHYRSFLGIREELASLRDADPGFAPAWPVADNPVLRCPMEPTDRCYIDDSEAARLLDFSCATYGLLLRALVGCFGRNGPSAAEDRSALLAVSFELMHLLGTASTALARLPASPDTPGVNAGMTFTMLRGTEPLIRGRVEQVIVRERLLSLAQAAEGLPDMIGKAGDLREIAQKFHISA